MRDRALRKQRLPRLLVSFALLAVIAGFAGVSSSQELQQDAATKKAAGDDGPEVAEKKRLEAELADTADRAPAKSLKSSDEQKDVESGQVETSSRRGVMLAGLTIFVLAIFVGFEMITKVPPTLHTPLMSGSNAISGITVVGALIVAGDGFTFASFVGMLAVIMATVNAVGGFLVTHRMLSMFIKKKK